MSYIPKILTITEEIIKTLEDDNFFIDFEISDTTYAKNRIADELTKKFLIDGFDGEEEGFFSEDEFDVILREIAAENFLRVLQKKGLVDSYEDENTEETFFLTEKGKEELNNPDGEEALNIFSDD